MTESGEDGVNALGAPTSYLVASGRRLAYRSIGAGLPLVLCPRFRGTMDSWDPAFLDALAAEGIRAIVFDPTGLGLSSGARTYDPMRMVDDLRDLADALGLSRVALGGWSLGGMVAQAAMMTLPGLPTHLVLIGTAPPGRNARIAEQRFYDLANSPEPSLDAETELYFHRPSADSCEAAARSAARIACRADRSPPVPEDWASAQLGDSPRRPLFPVVGLLECLRRTSVPILHLGGAHDIGFPVENWHGLTRYLPTLRTLTFPSAGNAPHHQYPEEAAAHVAIFLRAGRFNGAPGPAEG